jgi:uncharacterized membrane protein
MTDFRYGPVELYLIGFEGERPDPGVVGALVELLEGGLVRLLDFVIISRGDDGTVTVTEIEDATDEYGFGAVELEAVGIAGDDDIAEFAEHIPPGTSAALVALELAFARTLARRLDASGGVVLRTDRIPAPVVNAVVDAVDAVEGE